MTDDLPAPTPPAATARPEAMISARSAMRLVLVLLAVWGIFSGIALIFFQNGAGATIGGGLGGGQGAAAQRLLGVHILVLSPVYALLALDPRRYRLLLWLPYAAQGGIVAVTVYDLVTKERRFSDGALPLIVACIFLVLLVYVWRAGSAPAAEEDETEQEDGGEEEEEGEGEG